MQGGSTGSPGGNNWLVVNTCRRQRDPDLLKDTMSAVRLTVQLQRFFNMHNRVPGFKFMDGREQLRVIRLACFCCCTGTVFYINLPLPPN